MNTCTLEAPPAPDLRSGLAGARAAVAAVLPVVAGAVEAYRSALADFDQSLPAEPDVNTMNEAWALWQTDTGSDDLRAVLRELSDALALVDFPPIDGWS